MRSFVVEDSGVRSLFVQLSDKKTSRKLLGSFRRGLQLIAKETTDSFKRLRGGFTERRVSVRKRGGGTREKIRRVARVVVRPKEFLAKVHIMDDYRVKWFEMGTRDRFTKGRKVTGTYRLKGGGRRYLKRAGKGRRVGKIRPEWFFKKSIRRTQSSVSRKIDSGVTEVLKSLKRLNN